jgi:dephospho-CoA kinase
MRIVIGVVGIAGSGKTLVSKHLVNKHRFTRLRFAGPLKEMLKAGLGLTDEHIDGSLKQEPLPELGGVTPRHLMQTLGTEWGRRLVHPELWTNRLRSLIEQHDDGVFVVDDVRFANEAACIRSVGGSLWRVVRPGLALGSHISERAQTAIEEDVLINNALDIASLLRSVDALVQPMIKEAA